MWDPFGRNKRAYFHCFKTTTGQHVDKLGLVLQTDNLLLVLESITRPHFHNLDKLTFAAFVAWFILYKLVGTLRAILVIFSSLLILLVFIAIIMISCIEK